MSGKKRRRLHGTVQKVIRSPSPNQAEKAQIGIDEAEDLYREIRVDNELADEGGGKVHLKPGAKVDVILEADSDATQKKPV